MIQLLTIHVQTNFMIIFVKQHEKMVKSTKLFLIRCQQIKFEVLHKLKIMFTDPN